MQLEDVYTSTGMKYMRHPHIWEALKNGKGRPHTLQVSLTNKCNLKCPYCSVQNRVTKNQDIDFHCLLVAVKQFVSIGVKALEISGEGEPLLHKKFEEIVLSLKRNHPYLKLALITNGILLHQVSLNVLKLFEWIRISIQEDTIDKIQVPMLEKTTIGLSYVTDKTYYDTRKFLLSLLTKEYVKNHSIKYVRVLPDCLLPIEDFEQISLSYENLVSTVKTVSPIFFFQEQKYPKQAEYCYMDVIKPWLNTDGLVYPCNGICLNTKADKKFDPQYSLFDAFWDESSNPFTKRTGIITYYKNRGFSRMNNLSKMCDRCVFTKNNEIAHSLVQPIIHEDFI